MLNEQVTLDPNADRRTNVRTPPPLAAVSASKGSDSEDDVDSDVEHEFVLLLSLHEEEA